LRGHVAAPPRSGTRLLYDNLRAHGTTWRRDPLSSDAAGFAGQYRYEQARGDRPRTKRPRGESNTLRRDSFAARSFTDLDDLNAEAWCLGPAADRRCPDEPDRTVREVFAGERSRLLALPDNPAPLLEQVAVSVGKTPYVRFDLNEYSVPFTHVRRILTVLADPHEVRIVACGGARVSPRSYDKGAKIEESPHPGADDFKHAARQHRGNDRPRAVPASRLLERAAERGGQYRRHHRRSAEAARPL
jgi:hypothetical protein